MEQLLGTLFNGTSLTKEQAKRGMTLLKRRSVSPEQSGAFLGALRAKGESSQEIAGFVESLLEDAICVRADSSAVDCCGTGGDGANTFNISTGVAIILAAGGVPVAKHGNRSISSQCGSADVLEALGIPIDLNAQQVEESIDREKFGFMFAPNFHPVVKQIAPIRKAIGVRTVFNLLGPLLNPARVTRQLVGIFDASLLTLMAETLKSLGSQQAMVVSSKDGLDEISLSEITYVAHLRKGEIVQYEIDPKRLGFSRPPHGALEGGNAEMNARILMGVFAGKLGPQRDVLLINAAAGFLVADKVESMEEGIELAASVLDSAMASTKLSRLSVK